MIVVSLYKLPNLIICAQLIEKCEFKCDGAINIVQTRFPFEDEEMWSELYYCIIGNKDWIGSYSHRVR